MPEAIPVSPRGDVDMSVHSDEIERSTQLVPTYQFGDYLALIELAEPVVWGSEKVSADDVFCDASEQADEPIILGSEKVNIDDDSCNDDVFVTLPNKQNPLS